MLETCSSHLRHLQLLQLYGEHMQMTGKNVCLKLWRTRTWLAPVALDLTHVWGKWRSIPANWCHSTMSRKSQRCQGMCALSFYHVFCRTMVDDLQCQLPERHLVLLTSKRWWHGRWAKVDQSLHSELHTPSVSWSRLKGARTNLSTRKHDESQSVLAEGPAASKAAGSQRCSTSPRTFLHFKWLCRRRQALQFKAASFFKASNQTDQKSKAVRLSSLAFLMQNWQND